MSQIQLIAENERLCTKHSDITDKLMRDWVAECGKIGGCPPSNPLVMARYDEGDCDTAHWPDPDMDVLISGLFDSREMGLFPSSVNEAVLPDGSVVKF